MDHSLLVVFVSCEDILKSSRIFLKKKEKNESQKLYNSFEVTLEWALET